MAKIDFESKSKLVSDITDELALAMLDLSKKAFLMPLENSEAGYYIPTFAARQYEIDPMQILDYTKKYGVAKAKALIKPWVSDLVYYFNFDALGLFHNNEGKAFLFPFQKIEVQNISPKQFVVYSQNNENVILYKSAA